MTILPMTSACPCQAPALGLDQRDHVTNLHGLSLSASLMKYVQDREALKALRVGRNEGLLLLPYTPRTAALTGRSPTGIIVSSVHLNCLVAAVEARRIATSPDLRFSTSA